MNCFGRTSSHRAPKAPLFWRIIAYIVSRPMIANWLIKQSQKTIYYPIRTADNRLYMDRWWLFNPYGKDPMGNQVPGRWPWLPNIRVHHISLPDNDRHEHDHPWDARTIILKGYYIEERKTSGQPTRIFVAGDTQAIEFEQYHRITHLSPGGAYTLFITYGFQGDWGYNVDGKKVFYKDYK